MIVYWTFDALLRTKRSFRKTSESTKKIRKQKGLKKGGGSSGTLINKYILFMGFWCLYGLDRREGKT